MSAVISSQHGCFAWIPVGVPRKKVALALSYLVGVAIVLVTFRGLMSGHLVRKHLSIATSLRALEENETEILHRRKKMVDDACAAANQSLFSPIDAARSLQGIRKPGTSVEYKYMTWIMHDEATKALYCIVPKTGSTNLRRIFAEVKNRKSRKTDLYDWSKMNPEDSWFYNFEFLSNRRKSIYDVTKILQRPNNIKILSVRHPFERLISLYKMIFEGNHYENKTVQMLQRVTNGVFALIKRHQNRPDFQIKDVTFPVFIEYIIHHARCVEEGSCQVDWYQTHWSPIWRMCRVCSLGYDLVLRMETFDRDIPEVLKVAKISKTTLYPHQWKRTSKGLIDKYFSLLSEDLIEGLKETYKMDFKLFGYDYFKSDEFTDGTR